MSRGVPVQLPACAGTNLYCLVNGGTGEQLAHGCTWRGAAGNRTCDLLVSAKKERLAHLDLQVVLFRHKLVLDSVDAVMVGRIRTFAQLMVLRFSLLVCLSISLFSVFFLLVWAVLQKNE